jgi:hypothetical protein
MSKAIFLTYLLETSPISGGTLPYNASASFGYSSGIHCNYIQKLVTDTDVNSQRINFKFDDDHFPFMKVSTQIVPGGGNTGYGWSAYKIKALIQIVDVTGDTESIVADPAKWKAVDVTNQISGHVTGNAIQPSGLTNTLFEINPTLITTYPDYRLSYLNYPNALPTDDAKLAFGEEVFFFGNVNTDIEAVAYVTDIAVNLPINQFNYTENPTWDGVSKIYISEIGIFDDNNNLVGIAKLNHPIDKDSGKARSFAFNIEF